jgi:hypothetical protein
MITGSGALIITIILILLIRLCGGLKRDWERGTSLEASEKKSLLGWIVVLSAVLIWGLTYFVNHCG